jgi:uncharacterized protein
MIRSIQSLSVFVDTGAFGALALEADEYHQNASRLVVGLIAGRRSIVTTNFIVAETHAVVLARGGRDRALQALQLVERTADLIERISAEDERHARAILERYEDKSFSYTDATSFAVMERLGLTDVFTFDRHFAQFGFSPLKPN